MITDPAKMNEALLGFENINVLGLEELPLNQGLHLIIETKKLEAYCAKCNTKAKLKDRPKVELNDLTSFGRRVSLTWIKRRWYCPNDKCGVKSFIEDEPKIANSRLSISDRAARYATEQVGRYGRSVSEVANTLGCSWHTVNDAVITYGEALINDPSRYTLVEAIGLDETLFVKEGEYHKQHYSTQITDVKNGQLLDIVPGRKGEEAKNWFKLKDDNWKNNIKYATLDLSSPYRAVFNEELPHAIKVADPFHVIKLSNMKMDECRRRVQNEIVGHRGRKDDPLYRCRKLLQMANERVNKDGKVKLRGLLEAGDPNGEVVTAWQAKEAVRELYSHADGATASQWIDELSDSMLYENNPIEVKSLARTLVRWKDEIIAWHKSHVTNASAEGMNNLIKRVKRVAFGFTSFKNYRIRSLLYAGKPNWDLLKTITIN